MGFIQIILRQVPGRFQSECRSVLSFLLRQPRSVTRHEVIGDDAHRGTDHAVIRTRKAVIKPFIRFVIRYHDPVRIFKLCHVLCLKGGIPFCPRRSLLCRHCPAGHDFPALCERRKAVPGKLHDNAVTILRRDGVHSLHGFLF